jgi:hypothetical protein
MNRGELLFVSTVGPARDRARSIWRPRAVYPATTSALPIEKAGPMSSPSA